MICRKNAKSVKEVAAGHLFIWHDQFKWPKGKRTWPDTIVCFKFV